MSVVDEIKTKIDQAEREKLGANWEAYRALLKRLHDGKAVEPGKVKEALDALGKPLGDLDLDLDRMRTRIELRAKQQAAKEAKPTLLALEADLEKLKTERQKAVEKHNREIEAVSVEANRLRGIVKDGESVSRLLRDSCPNPSLKLELVTLEGQLGPLNGELKNVESSMYRFGNFEMGEGGKKMQDEIRRLNAMREDVYRRMELD
jgi:hypothetical protein